MRKIKDLPIERIILILFSILPVIDSINGILATNGLISLGAIYKVLVLGGLILLCVLNRDIHRPLAVASLIAVGYVVLTVAINLFGFSGKLLSFQYPVKLIFNVMTMVLLLNCIHFGYISGKTLYTILNNNTWLMLAVLLIPNLLGIGYNIYHGGIGFKGFFYSQNELSICILILFYFCLYKVSRRFSVGNVLQLLGTAACMLLLSNKTSMVAVAVGAVVFLVEFLVRSKSKYKWLVFAPLLLALLLGWPLIRRAVSGFMERQSYLHELYNGSLLDTIVSGRTIKLEGAWNRLINGPAPFLQFIIGNGFCSTLLVEMDFFDLFFYLGLAGTVAFTAALVWFFVKSIKNFKTDGTWMRAVGYVMVMAFAFLAGHTLFMATSGCYVVMFLCFCMTYRTAAEQ